MPITTPITWVHSLWTAFAAVSTPSPIFGALSFLVGIIFLIIDPTETFLSWKRLSRGEFEDS